MLVHNQSRIQKSIGREGGGIRPRIISPPYKKLKTYLKFGRKKGKIPHLFIRLSLVLCHYSLLISRRTLVEVRAFLKKILRGQMPPPPLPHLPPKYTSEHNKGSFVCIHVKEESHAPTYVVVLLM